MSSNIHRLIPLFCLLIVLGSLSARAQQSAQRQGSPSCLQFAQGFYDWYAPITQKETGTPAWDIALHKRRDAFSSQLFRALKADSEAQARAKGELVGLDFDPFVNSQDPADHYEARQHAVKDNRCSVEVWRASPNDTAAKSAKPAVIAALALVRGHWFFVNFQYPDETDLLTLLRRQDKNSRKP
jgi:hypothetical protein